MTTKKAHPLAATIKAWTPRLVELVRARLDASARLELAKAAVVAAEQSVTDALAAEDNETAAIAAEVVKACQLNPQATALHHFADGLRHRLAADGHDEQTAAVLAKAESALLDSLHIDNGVTVESLRAELETA